MHESAGTQRVEPLEAPLVDVVVDVPSVQVDGAFTYATGGLRLEVGSRVRVPFGGRIVRGWVVGAAATRPDADIKTISEIESDTPGFNGATARLARWMRRRYASTFREALTASVPRSTERGAPARFRFTTNRVEDGALAQALRRAVGDRPFTAIGGRRALRKIGVNAALVAVQREIARLLRAGAVHKPVPPAGLPRRSLRSGIAILVDAAAARGAAQKRLVAAIASGGGSLPVVEARRQADAGNDSVRRAAACGAIRIEPASTRPDQRALVAWRAKLTEHPRLTPTQEQRSAVEELDAMLRRGGGTALLQGITGSGKTLVYSLLIERLRSRGGRAIVLVPEIALTPQTASRFSAAFGSGVAVLHSGLSAAERERAWSAAAAGDVDIVVGARSAVFAPLPRLGLIIVDEEHEPSYKQDVAPRYDATTVARRRMEDVGGGVVLGSATPALESYAQALRGDIVHVRLRARATSAPLPPVEIVDMAAQKGPHGRRPLGPTLVAAIGASLAQGEKALLFVNRRGYAGVLLCRACGFAPRCRRCAVSLVLHSADRAIRCHICGLAYRIPQACPKCKSPELQPFGFGTQRVEAEVRELFPQARIVRMDADTTGGRGSHERLLDEFATAGDVLIGTQMIAKGLDFPTLTIVGIVSADIDLHRPDFRAAERTFALLTQAAGRAGRAGPGSRVVVQTYAPADSAIESAARHDYETFAEKELTLRRELRYPPFGRLAYIGIAGVDLRSVVLAARTAAEALRSAKFDVEVLGPAPDPLPKARGEFRMRIALKAASEEPLLDAAWYAKGLKTGSDVRIAVDVDPR